MTEAEDISEAVRTLQSGGIILYPTDTIWGLGCDATNAEVVERLFRLKHRPDSKAMLLLMSGIPMIQDYIASFPARAREILGKATRPTTIIYDGARKIAPQLMAADGSVGIRIPHDAFAMRLTEQAGVPVVSTSANLSGQKAPAFFNEIDDNVRDAADYVCHTRRDDETPSLPSDILKVAADGTVTEIRVFRDI